MRFLHIALLFAIGCTKKQETASAHREPISVDAGVRVVASTAPPRETAEPPHEPRFDVVAARNVESHGDPNAMRVDDVGGRVIVTSLKPLAMAVGDGPLVLEPKLAKGLDQPDGGAEYSLQGLAGTWPNLFAIYGSMPEARGVRFDLPLMRFTGDGWTVASNEKGIMPVAIHPFGAGKSLVLGWSTDAENGVPAGWSDSKPIWQTFDAAGVRPAPIKTAISQRLMTASTQDGHLFVFGVKSAGIWLAHYKVDGEKPVSFGEHALPGTQGCRSKALLDASPVLELFVAKSGIAIVSVPYPTDGCKTLKPGVYQDSEKGFAPVTVPLNNTQIVGVGEAGTLWVNNVEPDGLFRVRSGKAEAVPLPTYENGRCYATRVLELSTGTWMIARCTVAREKEVLFRFGRISQKPIAL